MEREDEYEMEMVSAVATHFYAAVPDALCTYCVAAASIAVSALRKLGVDAELTPCQLWYAAPNRNAVVGFVAKERIAGRWDGHVVCTTPRWFIDPAVHHLKREFGIEGPRLACTRRFMERTQVIGRLDLSESDRIWWHRPPPGVDATPPAEPRDMIERHANELVALVRQKLSQPA